MFAMGRPEADTRKLTIRPTLIRFLRSSAVAFSTTAAMLSDLAHREPAA
jgi:hypothetical protein